MQSLAITTSSSSCIPPLPTSGFPPLLLPSSPSPGLVPKPHAIPVLPLHRPPRPLATTTPSFCCCLCPHSNPLGTCCPSAVLLHTFLFPSLCWSISTAHCPAPLRTRRRWPPHPDVWHPQILLSPPWRGSQERRSREEPCFVYLRARAFCGDNEQ